MQFKNVDGLTNKETQAIVQQVHDAYDNGQTINLLNSTTENYRRQSASSRH